MRRRLRLSRHPVTLRDLAAGRNIIVATQFRYIFIAAG